MTQYMKKLFNDEKTYTIFMATFIVAMFVVLFIIWWPNDSIEEFAKYTEMNLDEKYKKNGNEYISELMFYVRYGQPNSVLAKVSNEYLAYVQETKEDLRKDVFSKKIRGFDGLTIRPYEQTIVYSTNIKYEDGSTRKMNLIETYPYNYSISFDDFMGYNALNIETVSNGVCCNILNAYYGENKRVYELSITNMENNRVSIDISNAKKIYLELENGEQYVLTNSVVTKNLENILKGTTVSRSFEFAIPFSIQSKIVRLVFRDVKVDGEIHDIRVNL